MANDYNNWFTSQLITLIQAIENKHDISSISKLVSEVQRGVTYASESPGSIDNLLVRMGHGLIGPIIVDYKLAKEEIKSQENVNVDELKQALTNREKNKVLNKMSGSLGSLKDFEG